MADENNTSIFFDIKTKTLNNRICCSGVKEINTSTGDKIEQIFISDAALNITVAQRDEWFDDIKEAFPEFVFKVENVENMNERLEVVKLPTDLFSKKKKREEYAEKIHDALKDLVKNSKANLTLVSRPSVDVKELIGKSVVFIQQAQNFNVFLKHGKPGYDVFTNFINIELKLKGKKATTLHKYVYKAAGLNTLKNPGILIKTNFHKIDIGNTKPDLLMSPVLRLLMHTFLRYTWSKMYELYLPTYFKIKAQVPDREMLEILSLANLTAHARPYYSLFVEQQNGMLSNKFIRDKMADHKKGVVSYITLNALSERALPSNYTVIKSLMKEDKYLEAFNLFEFSTIGQSKRYDFRLEAKDDYGFLKKGTIYPPVFDNERSYKVMADDYCHRWYKKSRFKKI